MAQKRRFPGRLFCLARPAGRTYWAEGWEEIEDFDRVRKYWLRQYLPFKNGMPGHDTIARVMSRLNPKALQASFVGSVYGQICQKPG
ncbi:MAG: transposase family protein [Candidatus Adiutrix sp.]|nr:transposase family protein [Candidatus Adiutrix sp.]